MTISTSLQSTALTHAALTTLALALVGCTQSGVAEQAQLAGIAGRLPTSVATPTRANGCTHLETGHVLSLVTPAGERTQLTYFQGCGWKYRSSSVAADRGAVSVAKVAARIDERSVVASEDPLSVFVDGPTGYTFAWTRDGGWKFVGHVAD